MNYNKKSVIYLAIFVAVVLVFAVGMYFVYKGVFDDESALDDETVGTYEDVIKDLTAPKGAENEVAEEVMQDLTPPSQDSAMSEEQLPEVSEEIINSLTAPE